MASPQLENGFARIANEIMDALARIRISGEATQILFLVLRKTYGFNKKTDLISLGQFCIGTGLKKVAVCKAISKLVGMNIITKKGNVTKLGNDWCSEYGLNKDCEAWKPLPKKVTLPKKVISVTKKGNDPLPKKLPTKDNIKIQERHSVPEKNSGVNGWKVWVDASREVGRQDPIPTGQATKTAKLIAAKFQTEESLRKIMVAFLRDTDKFLVEGGHGINLLASRIEKYRNVPEKKGYDFAY